MVTSDDINAIIATLAEDGVTVTSREIALVLLCHQMDCREVAWQLLYGGTADEMTSMFESPQFAALEAYYNRMFGGDELSYDEVKRGLEKNIKDMEDFIQNSKDNLEAKDLAALMGRVSDMRVKLVDKFGTSEKSEEHKIVVLNKFNDICPWCGREVSIMKNTHTDDGDVKRIQSADRSPALQSGAASTNQAVHPRRSARISPRKR